MRLFCSIAAIIALASVQLVHIVVIDGAGAHEHKAHGATLTHSDHDNAHEDYDPEGGGDLLDLHSLLHANGQIVLALSDGLLPALTAGNPQRRAHPLLYDGPATAPPVPPPLV